MKKLFLCASLFALLNGSANAAKIVNNSGETLDGIFQAPNAPELGPLGIFTFESGEHEQDMTRVFKKALKARANAVTVNLHLRPLTPHCPSITVQKGDDPAVLNNNTHITITPDKCEVEVIGG